MVWQQLDEVTAWRRVRGNEPISERIVNDGRNDRQQKYQHNASTTRWGNGSRGLVLSGSLAMIFLPPPRPHHQNFLTHTHQKYCTLIIINLIHSTITYIIIQFICYTHLIKFRSGIVNFVRKVTGKIDC